MGWSDEQLLSIPYSRLVQELRLTAEVIERNERAEWTVAAFQGWQTMAANGGKVGSFAKYLRAMNLAPPKPKVTVEEIERDKRRAFEALALVEARFDGGAA